MTYPAGYRAGVTACVRVLARIVDELETRPLAGDVERLCASPHKRRALRDLFLFTAEAMADLARPQPDSVSAEPADRHDSWRVCESSHDSSADDETSTPATG